MSLLSPHHRQRTLRYGSGCLDLEGVSWVTGHPNQVVILCGLAGLALIPLTFHLALLLGRSQVWLAKHLLVRA